MLERGYHIGRQSMVFNGVARLFTSTRAFKCIRVIPRRHSRRLVGRRIQEPLALLVSRCIDMQRERERIRINPAVVKRETVIDAFRHGRERERSVCGFYKNYGHVARDVGL